MSSAVNTQIRKPAEPDYPISKLIQNRFSPRAFDNRPVEKAKLCSVLEAARWAPSARNSQPWRFIVATRDNEAEFDKMLNVLKESNQAWAKDAPVLLLAVSRNDHEDGYANRHAEHDTGQALAYLTLQATELDLHVRMMGGFYPDKARAVYNIPDGYTPITALALGYLGTLEQLSEQNQQKEQSPRERKPLNELVFSGNWENKSKFIK